jgi:3',5'-cyclic AMP phosphodiesterase CpdA
VSTFRLAHFTDLHFTQAPRHYAWRDLLSKRCVGWANLALLGRYPLFRDAAEVTRACVADLARQRPDHVMITGDFTATSLPSEFDAARAALAPLLESGLETTVIPGNHDVYVRSALRDRLFERAFGRWARTEWQAHEFPASVRGLYPFPLVRLLGRDVALIALRDARPAWLLDSSGRVGPAQRSMLRALLGAPELAERTKVLALHYGLRRRDRSPDTHRHGLRDAEAVLRIAEEAGVSLVIHGHLHGRFVFSSGTVSVPAIADPGSLTAASGPRAYHVYHVGSESIELEARRYDASSGQFVAWPDGPGVGRVTRPGPASPK